MSVTPAEYQRFQQSGGVADLSARAKFRLTGADRVRYLNGQVTANVTKLAPGAVMPGCVTTAKGKLCGDIFIRAEGEALYLDAEPELREPLAARLEKYIIADDVTLTDVTEDVQLLHWLGGPAPGVLDTPRATVNRFGTAGEEIWLTGAGLLREAAVLSPELLELIRIEAGVPRWGHELGPDTLPPEAGLDRTHIDYHKGCYIGQETISRLRSVGHVNRELMGFVALTDEQLAQGMRIFAVGDAADARPLGQITSAAYSFALAKPIALGYLRRGSPANGLVARPAHAEAPEHEIATRALPFSQS
jgi:folate-binding protein YgfZ